MKHSKRNVKLFENRIAEKLFLSTIDAAAKLSSLALLKFPKNHISFILEFMHFGTILHQLWNYRDLLLYLFLTSAVVSP